MSLASATSPALKGNTPPDYVVFGRTANMLGVQQRLEKVAAANVPILIQGESGTGKEIIAKLIHQLSPWGDGPFVKVNCPAIPGTLIESELFGYERGAFTGAYGAKPGRVEMASRGTLFLDEIGEMDMDLQAKLLQVLQDGQFCRIGSQEDKRLEARVVCATNRALEHEIANGSFRQDLFYRINVVNLTVPPLRERSADIPDLVNYFLTVYNTQFNRDVAAVPASTMKLMQSHHWPGNIRELENLMKRYVILGTADVITSELQHSEPEADDLDIDIPLNGSIHLKDVTRQAVRKIERNIILKVLQANQWNRKKAARSLNISYRALLYKLKEAGLQVESDEIEFSKGLAPETAVESNDDEL
ncbi:MAG TPA: sigma-54 dependent transcriptional regulator [Terriglobales bacterium]|nr:sigma-54 dependent transcriptional regulator [Terriglobales bacterium]